MKKMSLLIYIPINLCALFLQNNYSQPSQDTSIVVYGNKTYHIVQIGDQFWLKENMDIGIMIAGVQDQTNNGMLEKYCYEDDPSNCEKYGALYTWNEAMEYSPGGNKAQGICPDGWHIPTLEEFNILKSFVNNDGNSLKEIGQGQGEGIGAGTNTSGFSAMLAGSRGYGGHFSHQKVYLWLWSSDEYSNEFANVLELDYSNNGILLYTNGKDAAFCVRCIKGQGTTNIAEEPYKEELIIDYSLSQNFPNPFNPNTIISYSLPNNCRVSIKVFDVLGGEIAILVNEYKSRGNYTINFDGSKLSNGIYYYQLIADKFMDTKKMVIMK